MFCISCGQVIMNPNLSKRYCPAHVNENYANGRDKNRLYCNSCGSKITFRKDKIRVDDGDGVDPIEFRECNVCNKLMVA